VYLYVWFSFYQINQGVTKIMSEITITTENINTN
jgi:hypothetical protein